MEFKEDKPTYFLYCEHTQVDKILRNTMYAESKRVKLESGQHRKEKTLHNYIQRDRTRVSKGGVHYDEFYTAECPICMRIKEEEKNKE